MEKANPAQVLAGFLFKEENQLPKNVMSGSIERGFEVDNTKLLPYLMKFQYWLYDNQPKEPTTTADASVLVGKINMTEAALLHVFKKVSLIDLSDCKFEYWEDGYKKCINAGEPVVDAIMYDGNIFWMMNNDGSMSPLNPMREAFDALAQYSTQSPSSIEESGLKEGEEGLWDEFVRDAVYSQMSKEELQSKYHITKK